METGDSVSSHTHANAHTHTLSLSTQHTHASVYARRFRQQTRRSDPRMSNEDVPELILPEPFCKVPLVSTALVAGDRVYRTHGARVVDVLAGIVVYSFQAASDCCQCSVV